MLYVGIWFISASTLLFEVALLRTFSIALWYHFSFMVVSIALLGYGASGSFLMLSGRLREKTHLLGASPALFALFAPVSYIIANRIPFDPARLAWDVHQLLFIVLYYIILSVPFIFSGLTIALALTTMAEKAGRVYAWDLLGAGSGPAIALLLFPLLGGEGVILASSAGGFIASLFILKYTGKPTAPHSNRLSGGLRPTLIPLAGILCVSALFIIRPVFMDVRISPYKDLPFALEYSGARLLETRWNAFSRVDLIESPAVRFAPGLSLTYLETLPEQRGITVDGDGLNAISRTGPPEALRFLDYLPTALPYKLLGEGGEGGNTEVFLIDTRGGLHILEAFYHGITSIKGSETNPLVADLANSNFSDFIYEKADIKTGEGRAILKGSKAAYDLIQLGVGSQTAAQTGFLGLTEDYRFTVEALTDYYDHLEGGGYLFITRYLLPPARGELKLVTTIVEALESLGIENPASRLVVFRTLETFSILLKKGTFDEGEIKLVKAFLTSRRYDPVHYPSMPPEEANLFNRFPEPFYYNLVKSILDKGSRQGVLKDYLFDISPSTDQRPFFHHFFKFRNVREVVQSVGGKWQILLEGGYLLPFVFTQALVASVLLIVLPLFKNSRGGERRVQGVGLRLGPLLFYFFLLGVGFMFVEITLIQKFILFLEHPEFAFSAVVSILLVSSGTGSFLSQRLRPERGIKWAITLLIIILITFAIIVPPILKASLGLDIIYRVIITALLILPLGIIMGMPFPFAIRYLETLKGRFFIPWGWAVNGCASVLGSVLSVMAAMAVGFNWVLVLAACTYLAALGAMVLAEKSPGR
jgi:hypothetical protein